MCSGKQNITSVKKCSVRGEPACAGIVEANHAKPPRFIALPLLLLTVLLLIAPLRAAETGVISIRSASMQRHLSATIILPAGYRSTGMHYPAMYLLHGYGGNHAVWPGLAPLETLSDSLHIIFICPDGENSWYLDSPRNRSSLFETFISRELVLHIDSCYRTVRSARGRGLMGLSMGGHGALLLLERHGDLFGSACAISGIMDLTEFPQKWGLLRLLGPAADNPGLWVASSCVSGVSALKNRSSIIILDCGLEDFALSGNEEMDKRLTEAGIPHTLRSEHGSHDWHYAKKVATDDIMKLAAGLMRAH